MAVSSVLSPEKIAGGRRVSTSSFQNFVSGGSPLGSSVVSSAANNVVGFQRASVRPATPDLSSIVNTISSNILSQVSNQIESVTNISNKNVDSKIQEVRSEITREIQPLYTKQENNITQLQSVVQNITQNADATITKIVEEYKKKVSQVDDAKPTGILGNFLKVFKGALDFIQFFASKKNLEAIDSNLKALQKTFADSFEVAKLIRNTINKIVAQLSNLPTASPSGSPGLNIDLKVPGGGLKQTAPRGVGNLIKKGGMFALGAGGLAAGAGAVNALADTGIMPTQKQPGFMGGLVEGLGGIVDSFTSAVNSLIKGSSDKSGGTSGGGGAPSSKTSGGGRGTPGTAPTPSSKETGPSEYSPGSIPKKVSKDTEFTKGVSELAKKYNVPEDYLYAVMGFETGGTFDPSITNKAGSGATGLIQFMPSTAKGLGTTTGELAKMSRSQQLKYVDKYFSGTLNKGASLSDVYMSVLMPAAVGKSDNTVLFGPGGIMPGAYAQNAGLDLNKDGKITKAEATKKVEAYLPKGKVKGMGGPETPDWALSPEKREELKNMATKVAQPPPSQAVPSVTMMPIDMSSSAPQQRSSGSASPASGPSAPAGSTGPTAPFLPAGNPDNFLILYSKIIYNIVDG